MNRKFIKPDELNLNLFKTIAKDWMLLTAGDFEKKFNTMTIGWGGFGVMWNKPIAMVVVRPGRYTFELMEKHDNFTLSAFPEKYRSALNICGTVSGRNTDKVKAAKLTPKPSSKISAPSFQEANLIFECRKIYHQDFDNKNFLDKAIDGFYPEKDYHRIYFGEILAVEISESF